MKPPDCTECGACCASDYSVEVVPAEIAPVSAALKRTALPILQEAKGCKYLPNTDTGHCVALVGLVGTSVSCAIYPDRPRVCVGYKPGDTQCTDVRAAHFGDFRGVTHNLLRHALPAIAVHSPSRAGEIITFLETFQGK